MKDVSIEAFGKVLTMHIVSKKIIGFEILDKEKKKKQRIGMSLDNAKEFLIACLENNVGGK